VAGSPLLPNITSHADYLALPGGVWFPVMRVICRRHRLPTTALERLSEGTNVIFAAGPSHIIKLFPPFWADLAETEHAVARHVHGRLGVPTPEVLARGTVEGWPYLVTSRLRGVSLSAVWNRMEPESQALIAAQLGRLMARLHALPTDGLAPLLPSDWPSIVQERIAACVSRRREQGLAEAWLRQIPGWLEDAQSLYPPDFTPAIVTGDLHQYHLLVSREGGTWTLCGYFDFDDAMLGFHEYDVAVPGVFVMAHRPELHHAFLRAYGYREEAIDEGLSRRLLAYTLLHRYRDLTWILEEYVRDPTCTTLEDLARVFYGAAY